MHTFSNFFFQLSLLRTTFKCFHRPQIETQIAKNGPHWKVTVSTARRRAFTWNTKGKNAFKYLFDNIIHTCLNKCACTYLFANVNMRMIKTSTPFKITIHIANYFLCLHFYTDWNNFYNKDGLSDSDFFFLIWKVWWWIILLQWHPASEHCVISCQRKMDLHNLKNLFW